MDKTPVTSRYNWRASKIPERPYIHAYHTSLVDKIYLCTKPNPQTESAAIVNLTFEQALERIKQIDRLTCGIPKIFYLVGWQFDGHDSKYPSWSEVNSKLMRSGDRSAADSLRWLMKAAKQFNSTVSLHINMMDAYENSPLWDIYKKNRLIIGKGGIWGGEQAYLIDYTREWEMGLAQQRIDNLVHTLPLIDAGTIHIDAFAPTGDDKERSLGTMRSIVRYWRNKGIDVTIESLVTSNRDAGLIGLSPMAWHINHVDWDKSDEFTEDDYLDIPAALFCGGVDHSFRAIIFGTSMQGEFISNDRMERYLSEFCLNTLPWHYLNHFTRLELVHQGSEVQVEFSDDLFVRVNLDQHLIKIIQGDILLRQNNDIFIPVTWHKNDEIIAYSHDGYTERKWILPESWRGQGEVFVNRITPQCYGESEILPVKGVWVKISLNPGEAIIIRRKAN